MSRLLDNRPRGENHVELAFVRSSDEQLPTGRLRDGWFEGNDIEAADVVVSLDDTRMGTSEQLRQISTADIREIHYYSASDATTKWGTGNVAGAIQVVTR